MIKRNSVVAIRKLKKNNEKISMITAYDHAFAKIFDKAGVDMILVGDSLGMVFQGHDSTLPVTMENMLYHTKIVVNATSKALIVADLPFMSYQVSFEKGVENACRLMKETGCGAVKLEGGERIIPIVEHLVAIGIPVFGHLGLTPQSINGFGSYRLRAKGDLEAEKLLADAIKLENAGASGIILEKIPAELAAKVSKMITIPTIGIGAGKECDGQVLVCTDLLGLDEDVNFKFVRKYANLAETINDAVKGYIDDVKSTSFPSKEESY